jgi:hypothetical protein
VRRMLMSIAYGYAWATRFSSRRLTQSRDGEVHRIGGVLVKRLMRPPAVVETEVAAERVVDLSGCRIGMQIGE